MTGLLAVAIGFYAHADRLSILRDAVERTDWPAAEAALGVLAGQPGADDPEVLFLTGMMASAQNNWRRAAVAFRRLVDRHPEFPRPRLELARILFIQGEDEAALAQFERVLADDVPVAVADNIRSFIDVIRTRQAWSVDLTLAPVVDDNLNGGTTHHTVELGGLTFNVNQDAKAVRSDGIITGLRARRLLPAGGSWRHELSGGVVFKNYRRDDFDDTFVRLGYGLRRLATGAGVETGGGMFATDRRIGGVPFSHSRGLRLDLRWPLGRAVSVEGAVEQQWVDYHRRPQRDGTLSWGSLGIQIGLNAASLFVLSLDRLREQASDPGLDLTSHGLSVGYYRDLPWGLTVGPNGRFSRTSYEVPSPFFGEQRRDHDLSLGIYFAKKNWVVSSLHPSINWSQERRLSSIDFFSYRRNRFVIAFDRRF